MNTIINEIVDKEYKHGFVSNIDSEILDKGLNVKTIQEILIDLNSGVRLNNKVQLKSLLVSLN